MVFIWKGPNGLMGEGHTLCGKRPGECVDLTEALAEKVKQSHGDASLELATPHQAAQLKLEEPEAPASKPTPVKPKPATRKAPSRRGRKAKS